MKKNKKIVAIIPIKSVSKRVKGKNFKIVNGKPLYRYLLDKLKFCNFDDVYVDSDSHEIEKYCKKIGYHYLKRKSVLARDSANGNDLINYHSSIIRADIYFQLFVTAPLLSVKSINQCINLLKKSKRQDSIITIQKIYSWFWFNKKPVNYKPKVLPRSQDASPIICETTGLYGITKIALKKNKCRIGSNPIFFEIPEKESLDIDNQKDIELLKIYLKNHS